MDTNNGKFTAMILMQNPGLSCEVRSELLSLKKIVQPILPQLNQVEERLKTVSHESEGILKESSSYVLCGSGKRLRASLLLLCASIPSISKEETDLRSAVELATAVELIHSATLVHDDIVDRAILRRLKPTVNIQFGEEVAILLGDFLCARAFEMISKVGDEQVTSWMAETTRKMCEGELDQLKHRYRADLSLEEYLSFIERKTASLISICARSGTHLAHLLPQQQETLAEFGLNIGIAYQMVDDLLDIVGSENRLGKTLRTDAGNGKMTLPLILLLKNLSGNEREKLLKTLKSLDPDWTLIQSLTGKYKIIQQTEQFAKDYFSRSIRRIENFPEPFRNTFEDFARFVLSRDY